MRSDSDQGEAPVQQGSPKGTSAFQGLAKGTDREVGRKQIHFNNFLTVSIFYSYILIF